MNRHLWCLRCLAQQRHKVVSHSFSFPADNDVSTSKEQDHFDFRKGALNDACLELTRCVCANGSELSSDVVETVAHRLREEALFHLDSFIAQGRDPNILTRAVRYLAEAHATGQVGVDVMWFRHMLSCVIELTCPNSVVSERSFALYADIRRGMNDATRMSTTYTAL